MNFFKRCVASKFYKINYLRRIASERIRSCGGLMQTGEKLFRVLRTEGIFGLRRRIHLFANTQNEYQQWIRKYDTITAESRERFREQMEKFDHFPLISIVMPVYNPPVALLEEAIWSVRRQIYQNWEFCIADDASTDPDVRKTLERHAAEDKRIKVVYRKINGHTSKASSLGSSLEK